jgi:hypothetical protein
MSDARWSAEERRLVEAALAKRARPWLSQGETVTARGGVSRGVVEARLVLEGGADGARVEIEARVELEPAKLSAGDARDVTVDALDLLLLEYLESGRQLRFSGVYEERELHGKPLVIRAERTFPGLDAQADALLGEGEGGS